MPRFIVLDPTMDDLECGCSDDEWPDHWLLYTGQDDKMFAYITFMSMIEQDKLDAREMLSLTRSGRSLGMRGPLLDDEVDVVFVLSTN